MLSRKNFSALVKYFLILSLVAAVGWVRADVATGFAWLKAQQQGDGRFVSMLASTYQATTEAVRAFRENKRALSNETAANTVINQETWLGTEYLARKIMMNAQAGNAAPALIQQLKGYQNTDGGWGEKSGYLSTTVDTAFAIEALALAGQTINPASPAWLLAQQHSDGGWSSDKNSIESGTYSTALVANALWLQRSQNSNIAPALRKAAQWLYAQRNSQGQWASDFLTSQVLLLLARVEPSTAPAVAEGLLARQSPQGDWQADTYTSAIALRALANYQSQVADQDNTGAVEGKVVDANSGEVLPEVQLEITGIAQTTTNNQGLFVLAKLPTGNHTLRISKTGYEAMSKIITVQASKFTSVGSIALAKPASTGGTAVISQTLTVRGQIKDGVSGQPLANANISGQGKTLQSDANGVFSWVSSEKTFTLTVTNNGYDTANISVASDTWGEIAVNVAMTPTVAASSDTQLSGTVRKADGSILANASIHIESTTLQAQSATDGGYQISGINTLKFTVIASAQNYQEKRYPVEITKSGKYILNIDLNPVSVPANSESPENRTANQWQILALKSLSGAKGPADKMQFSADIYNNDTIAGEAIIQAEVLDANGKPVGYANPVGDAVVSASPGSKKAITFEWLTKQFPPEAYQLKLRAIQPNTISTEKPYGVVYTAATTPFSVLSGQIVSGSIILNPPLLQANSGQNVQLGALVQNMGNVVISGSVELKASLNGQVVLTRTTVLNNLQPIQFQTLDFGNWTPTQAGNIAVQVRMENVQGVIEGTLYVGDRPKGVYTVTPQAVAVGTQKVRAALKLEGIDLQSVRSADPLYAPIRAAVEKGADYIAPEFKRWDTTNKCFGCHVHSQSVKALSYAEKLTDKKYQEVKDIFTNRVHSSFKENPDFEYGISELPHVYWGLTNEKSKDILLPKIFGRIEQKISQHPYGSGVFLNPTIVGDRHIGSIGYLNQLFIQSTVESYLKPRLPIKIMLDKFPLLASFPSLASVRDMESDVKENFYISYSNNYNSPVSIKKFNSFGQDVTTNRSEFPSEVRNFSIMPNGDLIVSASGYLIIENGITGARKNIQVNSGHHYMDVIAINENEVFVTEYYTHALGKINLVTKTYSQLGALPYGFYVEMFYDREKKNLYVVNTESKKISIWSSLNGIKDFSPAFSETPTDIALDADDSLLVSSYSPPRSETKLFRLRNQNISVEATFDYATPYSGLQNTSVSIGAENKLVAVLWQDPITDKKIALFDISKPQKDYEYRSYSLEQVEKLVSDIIKFEVSTPQSGNQDNSYLATQLSSLSIALPYIKDQSILSNAENLKNNLYQVLKSRELNGAWSRYGADANYKDSYVTALVGLAFIDYGASGKDASLRKAVQYLLTQQSLDGSWYSSIFQTKLNTTSAVMLFMPRALELVGGIDAEIYVDLPSNITFSNPDKAPTRTENLANGGTRVVWKEASLGKQSRDIQFDLNLANMVFAEKRPISTAAYLLFANSFNGETLRLDLDIPVVRSASDLTVALATDAPAYGANQNSTITATVENLAAVPRSGSVHLWLKQGDVVVRDLGVVSFSDLAAGKSVALNQLWNTGTLRPDSYTLFAEVMDNQGLKIDENTSTFVIKPDSNSANVRLTTTKAQYHTTDTAVADILLKNPSQNSPIADANLLVQFQAANGTVIFSQNYALGEIPPNGTVQKQALWRYQNIAQGSYTVVVMLQSGSKTVASQTTTFGVREDNARLFKGTSQAQKTTVDRGAPQQCTDTISNQSSSPQEIEFRQLVGDLESNNEQQELIQRLALASGETRSFSRAINTGTLPEGNYACVVQSRLLGTSAWQSLASAPFKVITPIIVMGSVEAKKDQLELGEVQTCTDTIRNEGRAVKGLKVRQVLAKANGAGVISSQDSTFDLAAGQNKTLTRTFSADTAGDYVCELHAAPEGNMQLVGAASYSVKATAVQLEVALNGNGAAKVLALLDPPNSNSTCTGLKTLELWSAFPQSLPNGTVVVAEVLDANGRVLDTESVAVGNGTARVNNQRATTGADLSLLGVSSDVVTLALDPATNSSQLAGPLTVRTRWGNNTLLGSSMDVSCSRPIHNGDRFGAFEVQRVVENGGAASGGPSFAQRKAHLLALAQRDNLGAVYIATDTADFTKQFHSGRYQVYALFSEGLKLDNSVQHELREAVYRGDGLLEAGAHDQRHNGFDEALGVAYKGKQAQVDQVAVDAGVLGAAGTWRFSYPDKVLKVSLAGASTLGRALNGSNKVADNTVVTQYTFGRGKVLWYGFDLLGEATIGGNNSLTTRWLSKSLQFIAPAASTKAGRVRGLQASVTNKGANSVSGSLEVTLPTGGSVADKDGFTVSGSTLSRSFSLKAAQTLLAPLWVVLPNASGNTRFSVRALVSGREVASAHLLLSLEAEGGLAEARAACVGNAYKQVKTALDKAETHLTNQSPLQALAALIDAANALQKVSDSNASQVRYLIARALWDVAQKV